MRRPAETVPQPKAARAERGSDSLAARRSVTQPRKSVGSRVRRGKIEAK